MNAIFYSLIRFSGLGNYDFTLIFNLALCGSAEDVKKMWTKSKTPG